MNFLEVVGVITCISLAMFFIKEWQDWMKKQEEINSRRKEREIEAANRKEIEEQEYREWASKNPEKAKEVEERKKREKKSIKKADDLYDLKVEMTYLKKSGRKEYYNYLKTFEDDRASVYWEGKVVVFPLEITPKNNKELLANLPWKSIKESNQIGMNTQSLMSIHKIPLHEMINLYNSRIDCREKYLRMHPERRVSLEEKVEHGFILQGIVDDIFMLKKLAKKHNTVSIHLRRK